MATLDEVKKDVIHVAEVIRHGDRMVIPEGMNIDDAIALLNHRKTYENEKTQIASTFDCFPWDGAFALFKVLKARYGWASMETVYSFFGDKPPTLVDIEVGVGRVAPVPWGRLTLFKEGGHIDTGVARKGNRIVFSAIAQVQRKHEQTVRDIFADLRHEIQAHSIYRGQVVALRFRNDDGEPLPVPEAKFVSVEGANKDQLIFSKDVRDIIETNLFLPIERMEDCEAAGMKAKHGVLLVGTFGVGKTLCGRVAAALAVANKKTFIYCRRAEEFAEAVEFATQYQPAIVFCEDIDRVLSGERTVKMDDILNIVDGLDTKLSKVIVVLTTNSPEEINPANVRPGRLDAVIDLKKPDAAAVEKLIRMYGGADLDPAIDLRRVAASLAGHIPAVIEEVVKRSKRAALKDTAPGDTKIVVREHAIAEAVDTMKMQLALLSKEQGPEENEIYLLTEALRPLVKELIGSQRKALTAVGGR